MNATTKKIFLDGIWRNNPILIQVLGICSTLAVTNVVKNTVVMCVALIFVCAASNLFVSLFRKMIPGRIRMMVEILFVSCAVILVDIVLKAYFPAISRQLGPYVGLIITNCIVMGRCEAFALSNPPVPSVLDGIASGIGYSVVLLLIALIREPLGSGTLWGVPVMGAWWTNWSLMVMAPGAFFVLATIIWIVNGFAYRRQNEGRNSTSTV
jgi:Na+-transporting NADH:ubiquinone oxidoreductase subunit D